MMLLTTSPPTAWIVDVFLLRGGFIKNVTVTDPGRNSTLVSNLSPGVMYMIRVAGITVRGVGNYSDFAIGQTYQGRY